MDDVEDGLVDVIGEAEPFEVEVNRRTIKNAEHDALPELRWQSGDAQIDTAPRDIFLDSPVLRQTALSDVHVRHHLDT